MIKINDTYEVLIQNLDYKGDGISKINDKYIYIPGALPEETVKIKITKVTKKYCIGEIITILKQSNNRKFELSNLGSLNLMHLNFKKQLQWQKEITENTLSRALKQNINCHNTITDNNEYHYRNKVVFHVLENENLTLGLYIRNSKQITKVNNFILANKKVNEIITKINEANIKVDYNALKHIMFKNNSQDEILITLISFKEQFKGLNELTTFLTNNFKLAGITLNIKQYNEVILGEKSLILAGKNYLKENNLYITDKSFMQVNFNVMNLTYNLINQYITGNVIVDAYSGIGSIGFSIKDNNKIIYMIENNKENINLANKIKEETNNNNQYYIKHANAEDVIKNYNCNTLIIDPPRMGLYESFINEILKKNIERVIYLSCHLQTLTRDLKLLQEKYSINSVYPIKMFPQTNSFETLVILDLKQ